ncbi:MAG: DUF4397 domain-containing protein [Acidimicrobiales bacterium]|nr:DUF4397 domain-containing protein [Acidimicrobiales bacterium]
MRLFTRLAAVSALTLTLAVFAAPAGAQEDARIHLIHGIPGVPVDVVVDGSPVIEGFQPGDIEDLSALAGETLVGLQVTAAGDPGTVLIDAGDTPLPSSGNVSIIAHRAANGDPTLAVFENDTSQTAAGEGRLTVRHTAAAPAVDVLANGSPAVEGLENPNEASLELPTGTIEAAVAAAGTTEPVIGPTNLTIEEGAHLIVYAVGSLDGEDLDVLTESITVGAEAPTQEAAPEAPAESSTPVPSAVNTGNSPVEEPGAAFPVGLLAFAALALAVPGYKLAVARVR